MKFRWQHFLLSCLAFAYACKWADAKYVRYKDPSQPIEARVEDLLVRMTLEEKIGQMTQIERSVASADVMKYYKIGSVLSGGGSEPEPQATPEQWFEMVNEFQKGAMSTRLQIPSIYGIDAVHGHNNVYGATIFPHNVGLGATRDPELVRRIGAATALEVRATGISYAFSPCVAVCRDPRWGRCYESYSEDPELVKSMTDIIFGLQGQPPENHRKGFPFVAGQENVVACAKHFVGDGGTNHGIDENNTIINYKGLLGIHMTPYFDAIYKGVSTVMISYSSWNGKKMHANRFLISQVLKKQLHFKGMVISDWQGIDRITSPPGANYSLSVLEGVGAGIDMVMVPYNFTEFINYLTSHVKGGFISMSRINDAVRRILRVKFASGLFENPMGDYSLIKHLGSKEHRDLAREAVRKSLVLLQNGKPGSQDPLLPLDKNAPKILVAGSHADNLGYQCGGWTETWQGLSGNSTIGTTILTAIKSAVNPSTEVVFEQNPDANHVKGQGFSYAIVVVGEPPYAEMPLVIEQYISMMDAFVAAWLPGTEGQGVTDVIFGDYGFRGYLPRTWFKSVDQLPLNIGDKDYDPLFPFGFGLTTDVTNATK
ncbi:hypothetical protein SUGI_0660720 [Cryptomeria japonica]|nr:hypothetical protein SUGI_0660720 [Cryptomeria japonica]